MRASWTECTTSIGMCLVEEASTASVDMSGLVFLFLNVFVFFFKQWS